MKAEALLQELRISGVPSALSKAPVLCSPLEKLAMAPRKNAKGGGGHSSSSSSGSGSGSGSPSTGSSGSSSSPGARRGQSPPQQGPGGGREQGGRCRSGLVAGPPSLSILCVAPVREARPRSPGGEVEKWGSARGDPSTAIGSQAARGHCAVLLVFPSGSWAWRTVYLLLADFGALDPEPKSGKVSSYPLTSVEEQLGGVYSGAGVGVDTSFLKIMEFCLVFLTCLVFALLNMKGCHKVLYGL